MRTIHSNEGEFLLGEDRSASHPKAQGAELLPPSDRKGVRVLVARSEEEVEAIRKVWNSWQWNPNADIDFYLQVLRSRTEIIRPHVLVLYRDGSPVAMLVGRIVHSEVEARLGYLRLFKKSATSLTFVHGGQAGDLSDENSRVLVSEVMGSLRKGEADLAEFRFVRANSALYRAINLFPNALMRDRFPILQGHWGALLPANAGELYAKLSPKSRKNLKWQAKKLSESFNGNISIGLFREREDLPQMFHEVESVARKTYHRALGFGFSDTPEMRQRMQLEAQKGWLRAYVLYVGGKPGAFWIGSMCNGIFHSAFLGYDDDHARFSPGIFLITRVLETFCAEGVREVDFGLGEAEYKQRFGNCSWEDACIGIFAPTVRGIEMNLLRSSGVVFDRLAKKSLQQVSFLPRVKKLWRNRARRKG